MITFRGIRPYYGDDAFLSSCRIQAMPTIENSTAIIPYRPGVLNVSKMHRERKINLSFELLKRDARKNAEVVEQIIRWAESSGDEQFIADEYPDRFFLARMVSADTPDYAETHPTLSLEFLCANPYGYSIEEYSDYVGSTFIYLGSVATWPVIRFKPSTDTENLRWTDGTRTILFDPAYKAQAGHEIVIDCARRICTDNGASIMEHLQLASDWLKIDRHENRITGSGGLVEWRHVFL